MAVSSGCHLKGSRHGVWESRVLRMRERVVGAICVKLRLCVGYGGGTTSPEPLHDAQPGGFFYAA